MGGNYPVSVYVTHLHLPLRSTIRSQRQMGAPSFSGPAKYPTTEGWNKFLEYNDLYKTLKGCGNSIYNSSHNMGSSTVEYIKQYNLKGATTPRLSLYIYLENLHTLSDVAQSFIRPVLETALLNSRDAIAFAAHTGHSLYLFNTVEVLNSNMYEIVHRYMYLYQYKIDLLLNGYQPTLNINEQLQFREYAKYISNVDYNLPRTIGRVLIEFYATRHNVHFSPVPLVLEPDVFNTINGIVERYNLLARWELVFQKGYNNISLDHVGNGQKPFVEKSTFGFSLLRGTSTEIL